MSTSDATSSTKKTWDDAEAPAAVDLSKKFEAEWHLGRKPDLDEYLKKAAKSPGAMLALLRIDLSLRWGTKARLEADWYGKRYPDLPRETIVALIYEEFCLREDDGEKPDPAEYLRRFPDCSAALRRVLDIHGLVGHGGNSTYHSQSIEYAPFPKVEETIAGFRLVEELGRGAFARVFRAEERQLADRPVALKVTRVGSREPQTLARLQHTNIVPVYSYRTDPATGLHVLCMPYFGKLTLAQVLADPKLKSARSGADLVEVLDRLGDADTFVQGRSTGRAALIRRRYTQSIAWWGARMADALQHAHDRGVLHRDVKPSNVLITTDGMPMLLDFNLARAKPINGVENEQGLPGGTLDYMSPEHLEELADGLSGHVDARSDIYGLGVLLFEALTGTRPFGTPKGASSPSEMLLIAAEKRRDGAPLLRDRRPDLSRALESVVTRCLEADPGKRYASASDLAADLQAVADDKQLRHASEPWLDRSYRWVRRHRRFLLATSPLVFGMIVLVAFFVREQFNRHQIWSEVKQLYDAAVQAEQAGDYEEAIDQFDLAARLALENEASGIRSVRKQLGVARRNKITNASFSDLKKLSRQGLRRSEHARTVRAAATAISTAVDPLRFRLSGFDPDLNAVSEEIDRILAPFFVLDRAFWLARPDVAILDPNQRARLERDVNELLFLWTTALLRSDRPENLILAAETAEHALSFAQPQAPWLDLAALIRERRGEPPIPKIAPLVSAADDSPLSAFEWGLARLSRGKRREALADLRRAVRLEPGNHWYHFVLAQTLDLDPDDRDEAFRHFEVAFALKPDSPWIRYARLKAAIELKFGSARLRRSLGYLADATIQSTPRMLIRNGPVLWKDIQNAVH